jgi:nucleoid DNA-binding protein
MDGIMEKKNQKKLVKKGKMQIIQKIAKEKEYKIDDFTNKKIEQSLIERLLKFKEEFDKEQELLKEQLEAIENKIDQILLNNIKVESIQNRDELLQFFINAGAIISFKSKNYVIVQLEEEKHRFKGELYKDTFTSIESISEIIEVKKSNCKLTAQIKFKQELQSLMELKVKIKEANKSSENVTKALKLLDNLTKRDLALFTKEDMFNDIISNFFDDITKTLLNGKEVSIEITGFGTFELKKHSRFGGMYVKFKVSQNIRNKLKEINQKNMSIDHIVDYTKQKGMIKKAYQKSDRYIKGKTNKKEDE